MSKKPGDRVIAFVSASPKEIRVLGRGVYDGDFTPPGMVEVPKGWVNPRITLDDGSVVWGYQCWWGREDKVLKYIGDRKVVYVDINDQVKEVAHEL